MNAYYCFIRTSIIIIHVDPHYFLEYCEKLVSGPRWSRLVPEAGAGAG